jgi:DNA topoisomerase IB
MPFQARGGFTEMLDALANRLRAQIKTGGETQKLVEAIARVMDAREMAQGNVNPQLVTAVLAEDLAGAGAA